MWERAHEQLRIICKLIDRLIGATTKQNPVVVPCRSLGALCVDWLSHRGIKSIKEPLVWIFFAVGPVDDDNITENEGLLRHTCLVEPRLCLDLLGRACPSRTVAGIGIGHCALITRLLTSSTGSLRLLPDKHIPYTSNISPNLGLLHEPCGVVIHHLSLIQYELVQRGERASDFVTRWYFKVSIEGMRLAKNTEPTQNGFHIEVERSVGHHEDPDGRQRRP